MFSYTTTSAPQPQTEIFWYEHNTPEQERSVSIFADRLQQHGVAVPDTLVLKRFLRARKWDVEASFAMYVDMLAFREKQGVDQIMQAFQYNEEEDVNRAYKRFYHKTDKYGRPIYIELLGEADVAKLAQVTTLERFINRHIQRWEHFEQVKLPACSQAAGRPIVSTVAILDLDGISFSQFNTTVKQLLQAISRIDQDYYPEHLGAMYIINSPFIFRTIWAFVRPLLDEGTAAKVQMLGYDYQTTLLEVIPAENLWTRFGGKSVVSDFVDVGPWSEATNGPSVTATTSGGANGHCSSNSGPEATVFIGASCTN